MYRYASKARARADELLDLLSREERDLLLEWVRIPGNLDLRDVVTDPSPRTLTILGQTPSKDRKWKEKAKRPKFVREWLIARYWAIAGARAMQIAAELSDVKGLPYRQAGQFAAEVAGREMDLADIEDMIFLRMLD